MVAQHQSFELYLRTAMNHEQLIEPLVSSRFDHQRRIDDADPVRILPLPLIQDFILPRDDERVQNLVKPVALALIGENLRSESFAVERSIRGQDLSPKL